MAVYVRNAGNAHLVRPRLPLPELSRRRQLGQEGLVGDPAGRHCHRARRRLQRSQVLLVRGNQHRPPVGWRHLHLAPQHGVRLVLADIELERLAPGDATARRGLVQRQPHARASLTPHLRPTSGGHSREPPGELAQPGRTGTVGSQRRRSGAPVRNGQDRWIGLSRSLEQRPVELPARYRGRALGTTPFHGYTGTRVHGYTASIT